MRPAERYNMPCVPNISINRAMHDDFQIDHERQAGGGRYVLTLEGQESVLTYGRQEGRILIMHTYVPPPLRGRGLGVALVARAVADARAEKTKIVPVCPFVKMQMARRPEWQDMLS